eukprot:scaffold344_cov235-Pinguiococcus_pyrenoidosus.AAC.10
MNSPAGEASFLRHSSGFGCEPSGRLLLLVAACRKASSAESQRWRLRSGMLPRSSRAASVACVAWPLFVGTAGRTRVGATARRRWHWPGA